MSESSPATLAPSTPACRERQRVRRHLSGAEHLARIRAGQLEPMQAINRRLLLDELRRYHRHGRFPVNREFRFGSLVSVAQQRLKLLE